MKQEAAVFKDRKAKNYARMLKQCLVAPVSVVSERQDRHMEYVVGFLVNIPQASFLV